MEKVQITIELSRGVFSALRQDPDGFVREMRVAAAVKWYESGLITQSIAAEIAAFSRAEFIDALNQLRISSFQYTAHEIVDEVTRHRK